MSKLHDLRRKRAEAVAKARALVEKEADLPAGEQLEESENAELDALKAAVAELDSRIQKLEQIQELEASGAKAMGDDDEGDDTGEKGKQVGVKREQAAPAAEPKKPLAKGVVVAGAMKMLAQGGGNIYSARQAAAEVYGAQHPVTRALNTSTGPAGGFMVPPDYVAEIIEILTPMTVVRASNPRVLPMPRGTLTLPRQSQRATAGYGAELATIVASQESLGQIVATYKKLTALVPISNDLIRYSNPSVDEFVRDDLAIALALREDLAFIRGDGLQDTPKGFLSFVNNYNSGANIINSTASYTLATVAQEIGGAVNKLESSNVRPIRPVWIMHPRSKNYLFNVQNSLGVYVYRDEISRGELLGIPLKTTTQIPTNLSVSPNNDCSEVYLVDMGYAMILDSMTLQLEMSREATYVDSSGATVSAFQADQTVMRAIAEHDFQMRQDAAIAVIKGVRWAPAIS